jgi:hypothetical protein
VDGIGSTPSEVLQCGVIESEELAALASALLQIQQGRHKIVDCPPGRGPQRRT